MKTESFGIKFQSLNSKKKTKTKTVLQDKKYLIIFDFKIKKK